MNFLCLFYNNLNLMYVGREEQLAMEGEDGVGPTPPNVVLLNLTLLLFSIFYFISFTFQISLLFITSRMIILFSFIIFYLFIVLCNFHKS